MPKKPKDPETYDEHLGRVVSGLAEMHGQRQEDVAAAVGMSLTTYGRRERGEKPFLVSEIERIAAFLGEDPGFILQRALTQFGGAEKLLSEARGSKDVPDDDVQTFDNVTVLGRGASQEVDQAVAAQRGDKEEEQQ